MTRSGRVARVAALGVALGLAVASGTALATPAPSASAHAYVVATTPANGSEVGTRPVAVRVEFDEPVSLTGQPDWATVIDAEGGRVDTGDAVLDEQRTTITIPLDPDLAIGSYIASWRVVSADTHPVGGSIQFGYGVPAQVASAPPPPQPSAVLTLAVGVAKGAMYLGLVLTFGLLPAAIVLGAAGGERTAATRAALAGAAFAAAAAVAQFVLQFWWILSAGDPVADPWPQLAGFATSSYGVAVTIRLAALAAAALVLRRLAHRERLRLVLLTALGLVAVATVVANGHGGAASWWLSAATGLHAVAAIAWLGGLVQLGWLLLRRRLTADRLRRMPAWSLYAAVAVAAIAASGVVQGVSQVAYPAALIDTTYGVMLVAKLVLVAVAVGLGAAGWVWTRRRGRESTDGRPAPGQTARLRSRVRAEAAIAVVVVVLSGVLSSITPAKDDWAPTAGGQTDIGPYRVTVDVAPARVGPQSLRITVLPPEENSPQPQRLDVVLSRSDGSVSRLEVDFPYRIPATLQPGRPTAATFVSSAVTVPAAGEWDVSVTVVVSRVEQYSGEIAYRVE